MSDICNSCGEYFDSEYFDRDLDRVIEHCSQCDPHDDDDDLELRKSENNSPGDLRGEDLLSDEDIWAASLFVCLDEVNDEEH